MTSETREVPEGGASPPGSGVGVINARPSSDESLHSPASAGLWARIKRHKVAEWTLAYAAFAFATLHAVTLLSDALEWPRLIVRALTLVLILLLPIVPILAWYHGVRALKRVSGSELIIISLLLAIGGSLLWLYPHRAADRAESPVSPANGPPVNPTGVPAVFSPPAHSIAVLPFLNMSGDPKQEYFSDGITEELLNALSRLNDLEVTARTSSFSFKGQNVDIQTIAHKLHVGAVLEGSVRRDGNTVRITVQLINAVSGFHLWSQTYDRKLTDILKVQTDVATSVAQQLEVKLGDDETTKIAVGGTKNPDAYDSYLLGEQLRSREEGEADRRAALVAFDRAIELDPDYAAAYADRAFVLSNIEGDTTNPDTRDQLRQQILAAAQRAVALAPEFGEGHLALGIALHDSLDFTRAAPEYERALALAPGSARVLRTYAVYAVEVGYSDAAIGAARRAVSLDPDNWRSHFLLAEVFFLAHRFGEAQAALEPAQALNPGLHSIGAMLVYSLLASGQIRLAQRRCESSVTPLDDEDRHECLAQVYHLQGRQADAERELKLLQAIDGDGGAFEYAEIYTQWGDKVSALQWLIKAERLRDPGLAWLKADWMLDPIRGEPQFKALEKRMHFSP